MAMYMYMIVLKIREIYLLIIVKIYNNLPNSCLMIMIHDCTCTFFVFLLLNWLFLQLCQNALVFKHLVQCINKRHLENENFAILFNFYLNITVNLFHYFLFFNFHCTFLSSTKCVVHGVNNPSETMSLEPWYLYISRIRENLIWWNKIRKNSEWSCEAHWFTRIYNSSRDQDFCTC